MKVLQNNSSRLASGTNPIFRDSVWDFDRFKMALRSSPTARYDQILKQMTYEGRKVREKGERFWEWKREAWKREKKKRKYASGGAEASQLYLLLFLVDCRLNQDIGDKPKLKASTYQYSMRIRSVHIGMKWYLL